LLVVDLPCWSMCVCIKQ